MACTTPSAPSYPPAPTQSSLDNDALLALKKGDHDSLVRYTARGFALTYVARALPI